MFKQAVKYEAKLRLAIAGPSGSGKTYTALAIASHLGKRIALVDTEHGSASKYADTFAFDVMELRPPFHPDRFSEAVKEAEQVGYDVVILDSLSHAWNGAGGALELVEQYSKKYKGNSYAAWGDVTPIQNRLIEAIVGAGIHVIATMRSKQDYILIEKNGKQMPQKVGMAPVQRDGFEYEFDVMLDMDIENTGIVSKSRCSTLAGKVISKPGADVAAVLRDWLGGAQPPTPVTQTAQPVAAVASSNTPPPAADPAPVAPTSGNGGRPAKPPTSDAIKPTKAMTNKLHALGTQKFGDGWEDARHELVGRLTGGRTHSSAELSYAEVVRLAEKVKGFPDFKGDADDARELDEDDSHPGHPSNFGDN